MPFPFEHLSFTASAQTPATATRRAGVGYCEGEEQTQTERFGFVCVAGMPKQSVFVSETILPLRWNHWILVS